MGAGRFAPGRLWTCERCACGAPAATVDNAPLRGFVEAGITDGSVVPCSPRLVIFAAMGMVNWVQKWFDPDKEWSGAQIAVAITEALDRALSSTPSAALTRDPKNLPARPGESSQADLQDEPTQRRRTRWISN